MKTKKSKKVTGIAQATGVAFFQGFEGILFVFFAVICLTNNDTSWFAAAALAIKEAMALFIVGGMYLIKYGPSFFGKLVKQWKTKEGKMFIYASVFGTAFGNFFYILAIATASAGYGVILTSLYPVFSMMIIKFAMKEKENKLVWGGAVLAVIGAFVLMLITSLVSEPPKGKTKIELILGMIFGMVAAIFWSIEGIFINIGLKMKSAKKVSIDEIIFTRNVFATMTTFLLIVPVTLAFGNPYTSIKDIVINPEALAIIIAISTNIIVLRWMHVRAVSNIGPKLTAIIDTNNFIVPAIVAQILVLIPGLIAFESAIIVWYAYFLLIPIAIGVYMVIKFKDNNENIEADLIHTDLE